MQMSAFKGKDAALLCNLTEIKCYFCHTEHKLTRKACVCYLIKYCFVLDLVEQNPFKKPLMLKLLKSFTAHDNNLFDRVISDSVDQGVKIHTKWNSVVCKYPSFQNPYTVHVCAKFLFFIISSLSPVRDNDGAPAKKNTSSAKYIHPLFSSN